MVRVREVSRDELLQRRRELLDEVGLSVDELRHRAESGSLVGDEWFAWDRLRDIDFLLGDDEPDR